MQRIIARRIQQNNRGQTTVLSYIPILVLTESQPIMPRRPRVTLLHLPLHVIQRGNNRQACFVADEDYGFYLDWQGVRQQDRLRDSRLCTDDEPRAFTAFVRQRRRGECPDEGSGDQELFHDELEPGLVDAIRQATNGNFALGDSSFGDQIALTLGRRVQPGKSGRPRKSREPESGGVVVRYEIKPCPCYPLLMQTGNTNRSRVAGRRRLPATSRLTDDPV